MCTGFIVKKNNSKNQKLAIEFFEYCKANPDMRFWQALRNWAEVPFIYFGEGGLKEPIKDTFYLENKKD